MEKVEGVTEGGTTPDTAEQTLRVEGTASDNSKLDRIEIYEAAKSSHPIA